MASPPPTRTAAPAARPSVGPRARSRDRSTAREALANREGVTSTVVLPDCLTTLSAALAANGNLVAPRAIAPAAPKTCSVAAVTGKFRTAASVCIVPRLAKSSPAPLKSPAAAMAPARSRTTRAASSAPAPAPMNPAATGMPEGPSARPASGAIVEPIADATLPGTVWDDAGSTDAPSTMRARASSIPNGISLTRSSTGIFSRSACILWRSILANPGSPNSPGVGMATTPRSIARPVLANACGTDAAQEPIASIAVSPSSRACSLGSCATRAMASRVSFSRSISPFLAMNSCACSSSRSSAIVTCPRFGPKLNVVGMGYCWRGCMRTTRPVFAS